MKKGNRGLVPMTLVPRITESSAGVQQALSETTASFITEIFFFNGLLFLLLLCYRNSELHVSLILHL